MSIRLRFNFEKWVTRIGQCITQGSLRFLFTNVRDRATFVAEESNKMVGVAEAYILLLMTNGLLTQLQFFLIIAEGV